MVRVSFDYDLMTLLARDLWHLRDELDVTSQTDHTFSAADIGPRRETSEALTDFYGAWRKSFRDAWQVMTDLGNLLDQAGKAFYDQDAANAAGAAQQTTFFVRQQAVAENQAYQAKLDATRRETLAQRTEVGYRARQATLQKQQDALRRKQDVIDREQAAQNKRQEAIDKETEELRRQQEPLQKKQDELQQRQQQLWQHEKELHTQREAMLQQKQDALAKEADALGKEQEPLQQRYDELQRKQQELWADEKALRAEQDQELQQKTAELEKDQKAYDAKQDDLLREGNALLAGGNASQADLDALQMKQDDLFKAEGEPLQRRWDALEQEQNDSQKAFEPLQRRQEELDKERATLDGDRKPLTDRQDALQKDQHALWDLEKTSQQDVDDEVNKAQQRLDQERDDLQKQQEPLDKRSDALQDRQETLWHDQAATEDKQEALQKNEADPLRQQQENLQTTYAQQQEALRNYKYDPKSGQGDPLWGRRDLAEEFSHQPPQEPSALSWDDADSSVTVSYKLDANGQVPVDKNGYPVETTTTVTDKTTGLTYSETYHALSDDGDSVTTTHSSDGTVTKSYVDVHPEDRTDNTSTRYVTDEHGDTLQIWTKVGDGDWVLSMDKDTYLNSEAGKEDPQQFLDRPPAYLTVENPLVDRSGRPAGDPSSKGATTQVQEGVTRTDYTAPDGAQLKVVTDESGGVRYVAGANNEIQEVWRRGRTGWYLQDSVTQHERYGDEPPLGSLGVNWA